MTTSLTSEKARRHAGRNIHRALRLLAELLAAALLATATAASAGDATTADRPNRVAARSEMVGVFTGEFVNGAPVYRLPALTVVARRDAGLARTGRGDTLARARPTRAGPVAIPQVQPIGGAAVVVRTRGE